VNRLRTTFATEVAASLARFPAERPASAILELLYLAQAAYGHLTAEAIREVAEIVGVDPTRVRGLVGFYSLFHDRSRGAFVLHYCTDLPCALRGANDLLPRLCARLGIQPGETTADGVFTLETVKCLAVCDHAPAMQVNLEYYYDLCEERLDEIIADLRSLATADPPRRPPLGVGPPSSLRIAVETGRGDDA